MAVRLSIGATRRQLHRAAADRVVLLALLGGVAGPARRALDARRRSAALLPPTAAADARRSRCDRHVARRSPPCCRSAPACSSGSSRRCTARGPISSSTLQAPGRPAVGRRASAARFRTSLVTAQIALSMALLVVGGPVREEPGQRRAASTSARRSTTSSRSRSRPQLNGYTPARAAQFFERLEERTRARCRA